MGRQQLIRSVKRQSGKRGISRSDCRSTCDDRGAYRKNIEVVAELERAANAKRNRTDRIADAISNFVGSMLFVYLHVAWFAAWIILNTAPEPWHFDPYPFTFIVSLEAIFLSTFILISQNHEDLLARRRNHLDLQINLLSEQENSQVLKMLSSIERHLKMDVDSEAEALKKSVCPEEIVSQIEEAIESSKQLKDRKA
jgi:uncharacterized membrane protein